jgi:hypothetical protein
MIVRSLCKEAIFFRAPVVPIEDVQGRMVVLELIQLAIIGHCPFTADVDLLASRVAYTVDRVVASILP